MRCGSANDGEGVLAGSSADKRKPTIVGFATIFEHDSTRTNTWATTATDFAIVTTPTLADVVVCALHQRTVLQLCYGHVATTCLSTQTESNIENQQSLA